MAWRGVHPPGRVPFRSGSGARRCAYTATAVRTVEGQPVALSAAAAAGERDFAEINNVRLDSVSVFPFRPSRIYKQLLCFRFFFSLPLGLGVG